MGNQKRLLEPKKGILQAAAKPRSFAKNWKNFPIFVTPEKFAIEGVKKLCVLGALPTGRQALQ